MIHDVGAVIKPRNPRRGLESLTLQELDSMMSGIGDLLNKEINLDGEIKLSNRTIWRILHQMDDTVWITLCEHVIRRSHQDSQLWAAGETALKLLNAIESTGGIYAPWTLTPTYQQEQAERRPRDHRFKGRVWYFIQQLREYRCSVLGIDFPNRDSSKGKLNEV